MAVGPVLNKGTLANQVCTGVVLYSIPAFGWSLVIPAGGNDVDKPILCMQQVNGGLVGGGVISVPGTGSTITFRREKGTDLGYTISYHPQGTQNNSWKKAIRLHFDELVKQLSSMDLVKKTLQYIYDKTQGKGKAVFTGGLQDQYQGDVYIADKYGPGVFIGRTQLTVSSSDMSFIQFNALKDKITTVTVESQLDTFTDKNTVTTSLNKALKAASARQGLGGRSWEKDQIIVPDEKLEVKYSDKVKDPVFRNQAFQGGAVYGTYISTVCSLQEKKDQTPVIASDITTYDGAMMKMTTQGCTSIKSPFITGLIQAPFKNPIQTEQGKEQYQTRLTDINGIRQNVLKTKLEDDGTQRILQLDTMLQTDSRELTARLLGQNLQDLVAGQVDPFAPSFDQGLKWTGDKQPSVGETMGDSQKAETKDAFTGKTTTSFRNNSIITQDPDGTITLKDGWGSQITLSHGNIYISSALDTFIRPGRDLIAMVPRHLSTTANGDFELASKKDIRIGSQKNLVLASAINGEQGYTVLQNRTKQQGRNSGMVIRSNGYLTITSSDDMHIGINDKRTQNRGQSVEYGKGSIFIQGEKIRVESRGQLRLLGTVTGLYACVGNQGVGVQLDLANITVTGPVVNMDTGAVQIGKFSTVHTIKTGAKGQTTVTLKKGSDTAVFHVRGQLQCRGVVCGGALQVSDQCVARTYVVLNTSPLERIPGTKQTTINKFLAKISRIFRTPLKASKLPFEDRLQRWYCDKFICDKEFKFKNIWQVLKMPAMCWQIYSNKSTKNYNKLKKIQAKATGSQGTSTYAYPGQAGWDNGQIVTIQENSADIKQVKLSEGYTTYTQEE